MWKKQKALNNYVFLGFELIQTLGGKDSFSKGV